LNYYIDQPKQARGYRNGLLRRIVKEAFAKRTGLQERYQFEKNSPIPFSAPLKNRVKDTAMLCFRALSRRVYKRMDWPAKTLRPRCTAPLVSTGIPMWMPTANTMSVGEPDPSLNPRSTAPTTGTNRVFFFMDSPAQSQIFPLPPHPKPIPSTAEAVDPSLCRCARSAQPINAASLLVSAPTRNSKCSNGEHPLSRRRNIHCA